MSVWATLLGACLLISFTPGAGAINAMSSAINAGFRRAVWAVLGQQVGLIAHLIVVALGLGVLVSRSPLAFNVVRYAGAAYLCYLGVRQFLRTPEVAAQSEVTVVEPAGTMFRRGLWVNLLNPKAMVFFLAFIPGFIDPDLPLLRQYLIVCATIVVVDIVVMWLFFASVARGFRRFTRNEAGQRTLNRIFGLLFIGVGVLLAVM